MGNTLWTLLGALLGALLFASAHAEGPSSGSLAGMVERESVQLTPAQSVLAMVAPSARGSFLLYQLATAINSGDYPWLEEEQELLVEQEVDSSWLAAMANEFQNVPVYESFPLQLQTWLRDSYGLDAVDVYQNWPRARSSQRICNAAGQCYEATEIVAACCPF